MEQIGVSKIIACEPKEITEYDDHQVLLYEINDEKFYDIWQLINILDIDYRKRHRNYHREFKNEGKRMYYFAYKDEIEYVMFKRNKNGGYYLKEFVPYETGMDMLLDDEV